MAKKRVSGIDLSWMIFDRMREALGHSRGVSVAVVPDTELGWRAIIQARSASRLSPAAIRKLRSIESEFRSSYSLAGD
jgi:hypothetical protein